MKIRLQLLAAFLVCSSSFQIFAQNTESTSNDKLEQKTQALEEAVKKLQRLKISGYVQAQGQWGEKDASLKVGTANENSNESFSRFGVRRGRIKFAYEEGIASGVFQLDITEKGVDIKDAYLNIKDPWAKISALRAGVFDRTFGHEISYSSSRRESTERSTIFQTLFPNERDLGIAAYLQPAKTSPLHFIKFEIGLFAGNGIKQETDSRKDLIGHLIATNKIGKNIKYGIGFSYYNGSVYQGTKNVYKMNGEKFEIDSVSSNKGDFAKREYFGFDAQISYISQLGTTQLRTEYLWGQQPGQKNSTKSPNASILPTTDTYIRNFQGGYILLVHDIGKSPFSAVVKYDWYDPNTKISKDKVGVNGTGKADLSQNTIGFGALWKATENLRLQAYYEINEYEKTTNIASINDIKDNVFTLRLQYKF